MRKIIRLTAAALLAASAVVGAAVAATADPADEPQSGIQADVGWGVAPASPSPSASATATDVGWG